jgi:hypothetical protein
MADKRPEGGTNARPLRETIAGTGPGIPDEALGPGEELPQPPSDEEVERTARRLRNDDDERNRGKRTER